MKHWAAMKPDSEPLVPAAPSRRSTPATAGRDPGSGSPSPLEPSDVSIIVPAHRTGSQLDRCLEALKRLDPAPAEVLVAVDGADQRQMRRVAERVEAEGLTALVPPADEGGPGEVPGRGPAAARNRAARVARGSVLVFLDSDVVAPIDLVEAVVDGFERRPGIVALFGSYDDRPPAPGWVSRYKNLLHHHTHQGGRAEASTFWAGCGAVRREAFAAVGGFDEDRYRRPCVEDIELGYRLRAAGGRIALVPEIQVTHLKAWTLGSLLATDIFDRALPWTELILERGGLDDDLNTDGRSRVSVVLVGLGAGSLVVAPFAPWVLLPGLAAAIGLVVLWRGFHALCLRVGGAAFAVATVPLHWLYLLYGGASFLLGLVLHTARRVLGPRGRGRPDDPGGARP